MCKPMFFYFKGPLVMMKNSYYGYSTLFLKKAKLKRFQIFKEVFHACYQNNEEKLSVFLHLNTSPHKDYSREKQKDYSAGLKSKIAKAGSLVDEIIYLCNICMSQYIRARPIKVLADLISRNSPLNIIGYPPKIFHVTCFIFTSLQQRDQSSE